MATASREHIVGLSDVLRVEEGSLYPALHRMEEAGWIKARWVVTDRNRRARQYEITIAGRRQLHVEESRWRAITGSGRPCAEARLMSWLSRLANVFRSGRLDDESGRRAAISSGREDPPADRRGHAA